MREDTLTDLRTGKKVVTRVQDEDDRTRRRWRANGVLVSTGGRRDRATTPTGATCRAQRGPVGDRRSRVAGARVYWRIGERRRTPRCSSCRRAIRRARPLARTIGRCKPRKGARLVAATSAGS